MTTKNNPDMVTVPGIKIYGTGDLNRLKQFKHEGEIGIQILDKGKQYSDLQQDTIALREQATLFQKYLSIISERELDPEDPFEQILSYLFNPPFDDAAYGNVTNDACDYDNGDKWMKRIHDTDKRVLWKVGPERFEETPEGWKAIGGEEYPILIPEMGWVKCTNDGLYRPDTGTPFETGTMDEAINAMIDHGIPGEVANKAFSWFGRMEEGKGTSAVIRYYCASDPFNIILEDPSASNCVNGRFPVRRSPRQADEVADQVTELASKLRGIE